VNDQIGHLNSGHLRPIDTCDAQIGTTLQQGASNSASAAAKINDPCMRREAFRKLRPVLIDHLASVTGDMAPLLRLVLRAEFLPEGGPEVLPRLKMLWRFCGYRYASNWIDNQVATLQDRRQKSTNRVWRHGTLHHVQSGGPNCLFHQALRRHGRHYAGWRIRWTTVMDEKDRLLLSLLRRDARRPVVALARNLGLSRTATQDRLAKLQASGAIAGFTITDGDAGAREIAYLTVKLERGFRCAQIVPKVRQLPMVESIHSVTGDEVDMIIRVAAEHIDGIEKARAEVVGLAGVAHVVTHVVLERFAL
jgi:Lrp/AsnC family transcriptional regulator, leucine-responsive regulatory protein